MWTLFKNMFYDWNRCHICVKMLKVINWELTRADQRGRVWPPSVFVKSPSGLKSSVCVLLCNFCYLPWLSVQLLSLVFVKLNMKIIHDKPDIIHFSSLIVSKRCFYNNYDNNNNNISRALIQLYKYTSLNS